MLLRLFIRIFIFVSFFFSNVYFPEFLSEGSYYFKIHTPVSNVILRTQASDLLRDLAQCIEITAQTPYITECGTSGDQIFSCLSLAKQIGSCQRFLVLVIHGINFNFSTIMGHDRINVSSIWKLTSGFQNDLLILGTVCGDMWKILNKTLYFHQRCKIYVAISTATILSY